MGITEAISSFVINFIASNGYLAVFVLIALGSALIPIPSEVVLPFAGFGVLSGRLDFWTIVVVGIIGQLLGSIVTYFLGLYLGREFLEKYGKYVLIKKHDIDLAHKWFEKYGEAAVFFGRILPVVRAYISLPAGVAKMDFKKFITFSTLGIVPWTIALTVAGVKLGENWVKIKPYFRIFDILVIVAVILLLAKFIWSHLKKNA